MIRGLYNHLDTHLKELEDKFKKDEIELRQKMDVEIKSQMSSKLKELNYKQTENYKHRFLYDISQSTLYRAFNGLYIENNYSGNYGREQTDIKYKLEEISSSLLTNCISYHYFFNNLHLLNNDKLLQKDEYIIGFIGHINVSNHNSGSYNISIGASKELQFITNYLNCYDIILQYNHQITNKTFNERYQLKRDVQNDMKLYDEQIDIITSSFSKLQIYIQTSQSSSSIYNNYIFYTLYDEDVIKAVHNFNKKLKYDKEIKEINYSSLKQECIEDTDIELGYKYRLKCCQKCHNKEKSKLYKDLTYTIPVKKILNRTIDLNSNKTIFHIF